MADRTSAEIFAMVFAACSVAGEAGKAIAHKLWPMRLEYDFSDNQMQIDEELIKLELAKRVKSEDGEGLELQRIVYLQPDGTFKPRF
jgi:hypothetical protein